MFLLPQIYNRFPTLTAFSFPEPTIFLACGRNRELCEQPFQAYAVDAGCVRPVGQNSVISFVISKWLLAELLFSDRWSKGTRLWERDCKKVRKRLQQCLEVLWVVKVIRSLFEVHRVSL